jgi:hypothetical protein
VVYFAIIVCLLVGILIYIVKKRCMPKALKVFLSFIVIGSGIFFSLLLYNSIVNLKLKPLVYPKVEMGTLEDRGDSRVYFEMLMFDKVDPELFISSVEGVIDSPQLILPYDNPELMLVDGVRGQRALPVENASLYVPILGNLKEQLLVQKGLIFEELNSGQLEVAQKRVYLLLALGNRYLKHGQLIPAMIGLYICEHSVELLEKYPQLLDNPFIFEELKQTKKAQSLLEVALANDTKTLLTIFDNGFYQEAHSGSSNPFSLANFFNRGYLKDYYEIQEEPLLFEDRLDKMAMLRKKALWSLQLPTYYVLGKCYLGYPSSYDDAGELSQRVAKLQSKIE